MNKTLFILLLGALILLPGIGQPVMQRQQELRVALCARTMVQGGSWLIPEFQGNPRLRKPPLMYWIDAVSFKIAGGIGSERSARIPSALAALMLLLLVYKTGQRLYGGNAGTYAAIVLATSLLFIRHGRSAETDMTLGLFTAAAVLLLAGAMKNPKAWNLWIGSGLCMGLGFLTKGPAALALPLGTTLLLSFFSPRVKFSKTIAPLLLCLAITVIIGAPWYIYITQTEIAQTALATELTATFVKTQHPGNIAYYLYSLPLAMLPWGLILPFVIIRAVKNRALTPPLPLCWLGLGFTLLTITPSKQLHYALLLLPPAALLCGEALNHWLDQLKQKPANRFYRSLQALLALAALGLILAPLHYEYLQPARPILCGLALLGLNLITFRKSSNPRQLAIWALSYALTLSAYITLIVPHHAQYGLLPHYLRAHRSLVKEVKHVHTVGLNSAIVEFYTQHSVHPVETLDQALKQAWPDDLIIAIGAEERINGGNPLPEGALNRIDHRGIIYSSYLR